MEAVLISAGVVALAEIGDKTQLLAIVLAARFRTPGPIMLGILVATALNHGIAATVGNFLGDWLSGDNLRWILAVSFIVIAVWMLLPENAHKPPKMFADFGAFGTTLVSFFLVEFGDATQLATMTLAARFHSIFAVAFGTTLGILVADIPAIYFGKAMLKKIPLPLVKVCAAVIFIALAIGAVLGWGSSLLAA